MYGKGVQKTSGDAVYQTLVNYGSGDMWALKVEQFEALKVEEAYFVDCVLNNKKPFNDGVAGLHVVHMLASSGSISPTEE